MAHGILVKNSGNQVVISEDYTNYIEVASGTLACVGGTGPVADASFTGYSTLRGGTSTPTMGDGSTYSYEGGDVVFIRLAAGWTGGGAYSYGGEGSSISFTYFGAGTLEYKVFRRVDIISSVAGFGLEVYKADGTTLAFSSMYKVPNIFNIVVGPSGFSFNDTLTGGHPYVSANINTGWVASSGDAVNGSLAWQGVYSYSNGVYGTRVYTTYGGIGNYQVPIGTEFLGMRG